MRRAPRSPPTLTPKNTHDLARRLPNSNLIIYPDAGHGGVFQFHADIYFGPTAPSGKESNWVQTWPGKGWNVILRLYGPLQPFFDKTWRPGEIEEVR
jgi:hypothetical protein